MLTSLAIVLLGGMVAGALAARLRLPALTGMVLFGVLVGPGVLGMLSPELLNISADLRKVALIIILTRAGLALDLGKLRQVGRPAVLLCFVPAACEILGCILLAPRLLGVSVLEAAIMGAVIAAVSPAVVVPRMLRLISRGRGGNIPQMIMAGASVDDVFVIVVFTALTGLAVGDGFSALSLVQIPVSIALGILVGVLCGLALHWVLLRIECRDSIQALVVLSLSFLLCAVEDALKGTVPFASLLAVMAMCAVIFRKDAPRAERLAGKFGELWAGAEILLFVLVGATVDPRYAAQAGLAAAALIVGAMLFRMGGVQLCLLKTPLKKKERLFCGFAYMPKATVQAAIGAIPLSMGLPCGEIVLTVAVLAILLTAPIGAALVDGTEERLLG